MINRSLLSLFILGCSIAVASLCTPNALIFINNEHVLIKTVLSFSFFSGSNILFAVVPLIMFAIVWKLKE